MKRKLNCVFNDFLRLVLLCILPLSAVVSAEVFQAENYDEAFDVTPGNAINVFRNGDVDLEITTDDGGGYDVGWIDATEWLMFHNFTASTTGNYTIRLRVASVSGATASVDLNSGSIPLGDFIIPATGGWQNWTTVSRTVKIQAGTYNLRVFAKTNGWNINWIEVIPDNSNTISATDTDRSLFVHDQATLQAADFSLRSTLQQLTNQINGLNRNHPSTVEEFFARMWDTQNFAPGQIAGGPKCTGFVNNFIIECRAAEGFQVNTPGFFIDNYTPLGLVNRFDLRDTNNFSDCGEYRIIYGLTGANGRNFIIFEAQLPNPTPGSAAGCLPVAQFWQHLSDETDSLKRAQLLHDFYFNGIASQRVNPVIDISNYMASTGQIRTNMFMGGSWLLKEFKVGISSDGFSVIAPVSVKSNPHSILFNSQNSDARIPAFQADFLANIGSLLGDLATFTLTVANDTHNNGQSHSSSILENENGFANSFFAGTSNNFRQQVADKLATTGSNLSVAQVINRATAMTCAGCHNPGDFGLTTAGAIGPNQSWPNTLGFTHISEFPIAGVFPLSPALTDVFLPARKTDFRNYLLSNGITTNALAVNSLSSKTSTASVQPKVSAKSAPVQTVKKFTKRSG